MPIHSGKGWANEGTGYVWLTFVVNDDPEFVESGERIEGVWDAGYPTYYGSHATTRYQHFNSASDEIANSGIEILMGDAPGEHSYWPIGTTYGEHMLRAGYLPGQRILFRTTFQVWSGYEGDCDTDFSAEPIYAEPYEIADALLAETLAEDFWPMKIMKRGGELVAA